MNSQKVKLKTYDQLVREGWGPVRRKDGTRVLRGPNPSWRSIPEQMWTLLGMVVVVEHSEAIGYTYHGLSFSAQAIEGRPPYGAGAPQPAVVAAPTAPKCTCNIRAMWDRGCQCGAFAAEMAAKKRGVS